MELPTIFIIMAFLLTMCARWLFSFPLLGCSYLFVLSLAFSFELAIMRFER